MAESVGQIGLDLTVNKNGFEQQMKGIQGLAKKAGAAIAAAFAVKKLVDFTQECVRAAQIQQEAEAKLETVMRQRMKATSAAIQSVKDFTSAQQALGVVGDETQMAGTQQLSTFLQSKDALETLIPAMNNLAVQQNGVNVSAGDMVNIGNLMGKVMQGQTAALTRVGITFSEAEEKAIKYGNEQQRAAMLAQVITNNVGEMNQALAATPAGQIQQLKNNFGDLCEVIGTGIQAAIMPVVRVLNLLVSKLLTAANALKAFFALFGGGKGGGTSVKAMTAGTDAVAASADDASAALGGAGGAAKKAAKDIKTSTTGIDELNVLSPDKESGGGGGGKGGGGGSYAADDFDMGELDSGAAAVDSRLKGIVDRINELKNLFGKGFLKGFGDVGVFDRIKGHIDGIKKSLIEIGSDPKLRKAAHDCANSFAYNFGRISGSLASIGATWAENLTGGMDRYLNQSKGLIKENLTKLFKIGEKRAEITGDFYEALGDVFTVFRSPQSQQITADLLGIIGNTTLQASVLLAQFLTDMYEALTKPFTENTEGIKGILLDLLSQIGIITGSLRTLIQNFMSDLQKMYDAHVAPLIKSIGDGLSYLAGVVIKTYNEYIKPVIDKIGPDVQNFVEQYLTPLMAKAVEVMGKVFDLTKIFWENVLMPLLSWLIQTAAPIVATFIDVVWQVVKTLFEDLSKVFSDILDIFQGVIDFLTGVFTGDWDLAWKGIKEILSSVWNLMKDIIVTALHYVLGRIDVIFKTIKAIFETIWNGIKSFLSAVWEGIKGKAAEVFEAIRKKLSEIWDNVKKTIEEKWNAIKQWFSDIWQKIKDIFKPGEMEDTGKRLMQGLWDGLKSIWNKITGWLKGCADFIAGVWDGIVDSAKSAYESAREEAREKKESKKGGSYKKFARGGFPEDGWFRASHGELIGQFDNGQTAVANNGQITSGISRAVQQGMASVMAPVVSAMKSAVAPPPLTAVAASGGASRVVETSTEREGDNYAFDDKHGDTDRIVASLEAIAGLLKKMDLTVSLDARDIRKSLVELDERRGYTLRTT